MNRHLSSEGFSHQLHRLGILAYELLNTYNSSLTVAGPLQILTGFPFAPKNQHVLCTFIWQSRRYIYDLMVSLISKNSTPFLKFSHLIVLLEYLKSKTVSISDFHRVFNIFANISFL